VFKFCDDLDHRLDIEILSGFVTIGIYGKWLTMIRQLAALVRRALAEVCTVPVLLVIHCSLSKFSDRRTAAAKAPPSAGDSSERLGLPGLVGRAVE